MQYTKAFPLSALCFANRVRRPRCCPWPPPQLQSKRCCCEGRGHQAPPGAWPQAQSALPKTWRCSGASESFTELWAPYQASHLSMVCVVLGSYHSIATRPSQRTTKPSLAASSQNTHTREKQHKKRDKSQAGRLPRCPKDLALGQPFPFAFQHSGFVQPPPAPRPMLPGGVGLFTLQQDNRATSVSYRSFFLIC